MNSTPETGAEIAPGPKAPDPAVERFLPLRQISGGMGGLVSWSAAYFAAQISGTATILGALILTSGGLGYALRIWNPPGKAHDDRVALIQDAGELVRWGTFLLGLGLVIGALLYVALRSFGRRHADEARRLMLKARARKVAAAQKATRVRRWERDLQQRERRTRNRFIVGAFVVVAGTVSVMALGSTPWETNIGWGSRCARVAEIALLGGLAALGLFLATGAIGIFLLLVAILGVLGRDAVAPALWGAKPFSGPPWKEVDTAAPVPLPPLVLRSAVNIATPSPALLTFLAADRLAGAPGARRWSAVAPAGGAPIDRRRLAALQITLTLLVLGDRGSVQLAFEHERRARVQISRTRAATGPGIVGLVGTMATQDPEDFVGDDTRGEPGLLGGVQDIVDVLLPDGAEDPWWDVIQNSIAEGMESGVFSQPDKPGGRPATDCAALLAITGELDLLVMRWGAATTVTPELAKRLMRDTEKALRKRRTRDVPEKPLTLAFHLLGRIVQTWIRPRALPWPMPCPSTQTPV